MQECGILEITGIVSKVDQRKQHQLQFRLDGMSMQKFITEHLQPGIPGLSGHDTRALPKGR